MAGEKGDVFLKFPVLAASAAVVLLAAPALAASEHEVYGVWANPKATVHIDIKPCGELACGTVVWASADAKEKSMKASGKELIGLQLFQDMKRDDEGVYRGRAFVPDLNMTFSGTAEAVSGETLKIRGCLVRNIFCRAQIWTKVG